MKEENLRKTHVNEIHFPWDERKDNPMVVTRIRGLSKGFLMYFPNAIKEIKHWGKTEKPPVKPYVIGHSFPYWQSHRI